MTPEQQRALALARARRRRQEAEGAKSAAPVPAQDESGGFLGFLNQGIATTLGAPVDLVNWGMGALGVPVSDTPFLGSRSLARGMQSIGARVADPGVQPDTFGEYVGRGLGGAAGALLPGAGVVGALGSSASPVAQGVAQTLSRPFLSTPGRALVAEALAGAGAGAGELAGQNIAPDNPYAQVAGALIGGVAGGMGPNIATRAAQSLPGVQLAENIATSQIAPFTARGAMHRARGRVQGLAEDVDVARENLARPTEADLSPAVRTGDRRLMALEQSVRNQESAIDRSMRDAETAAAQILREGIEGIGEGGDIQTTRDFLTDRVRSLVTRMDERVAQAEQRARERLADIEPSQSASQSSIVVREELERALQAARQQERQLWQSIPSDEVVPLRGAKARYNELIRDIPRAQRDDIPEAARRFLGEGNDAFRAQESVKEVHGLYSALREEARNARAGDTPNRNRARLADEFADALLEDMQAVEAASGPLREALDFSREVNARFNRGSVGRVLGSERTGGDRVADIQTLDATIGRAGRSGAVGYDEVARALADDSPASRQAMQDYIASRFRDAAVRDDGIRPGPAGSFIRSNEDLLERLPESRERIVEALSSSEAASRLRETAARRAQGLERSSAASTLSSSRPGEEVRAIFRSRDPRQTAAQLVRQARRDPTGEASRGLKGALIDDLMSAAKTGQFDDADAPVISGRAIRSRLADKQFADVASEILTPEELSRVRRIADEFSALERMQGRLPDAGAIMGDEPNSMIAYLARVVAARSGAAMGAGTSGASLQTASMASNRMKRILESLTNDRAEQLIIQAVSGDKELFDALLQPMSSITRQQEDRIVETIAGLLGAETASEGRPLEMTVTQPASYAQ